MYGANCSCLAIDRFAKLEGCNKFVLKLFCVPNTVRTRYHTPVTMKQQYHPSYRDTFTCTLTYQLAIVSGCSGSAVHGAVIANVLERAIPMEREREREVGEKSKYCHIDTDTLLVQVHKLHQELRKRMSIFGNKK